MKTVTGIVLGMGLALSGQASVVVHGSDKGYQESQKDWLSATANDIGPTAGYGTDGFIMFGDGGADSIASTDQAFARNVQIKPPYVTRFVQGADFHSVAEGRRGYGRYDDPVALDGTDAPGGILVAASGRGAGSPSELMTFTVAGLKAGTTVRVGVLSNVDDNSNGRWDPTSITLSDGTSSATVADLAHGAGQTDWVFFDIDANGTYKVGATQRLATQGVSIGGLTFDSIPEPATAGKPRRAVLSQETAATNTRGETAQPDMPAIKTTRSAAKGIGIEAGVMRRDPSDVIKVGDLYYVWYSKGKISPGYDATVWYASSPDGHVWTERGMALAKGKPGTWEGASVFTPNILVAEGRYWLFYTGTSRPFKKPFNPDSKIGIAVSDSPDGPWERLATNPALSNSGDPKEFDSHLVDDACLIVRDGKYWFYYKGRQLGKGPGQTQMGVAIADKPQGPYVRHEENPVIPGNHEVLVWPQCRGVAAMIGTTGPKHITNTIQYAEDGVNFTKTHDVKNGPWAGGTYRPEAFTQSGTGDIPKWGVEIGRAKGNLPFIQRFDLAEKR